MSVTFWLVLYILIIPLLVTAIIYHFRHALKDHDHIINFWFSAIGLLAAIWFGFSAEQLGNEANNLGNKANKLGNEANSLADISQTISENGYYYFTIETDKNSPRNSPEVVLKSGTHRTFYVIIRNKKLSSVDEPIVHGMYDGRNKPENNKRRLSRLELGSSDMVKDDYFTSKFFYYHFVVGEGLNGQSQANGVVFIKDNIEDKEKLLTNGEYLCQIEKSDLLEINSESYRQAHHYADKVGRTFTENEIREIEDDYRTILESYEKTLKRVKEVF
ncbi:hypothetical protein ABQD97_05030 [Enterococcus avium]|uniref:SMODS-associating 2TM beta-strand rich effector domain-containing protein n=1 Tax=Enterococcus avium TaxID=33945 RepID=A0ABD5F777_ENTAV|nr:hypothetical protein [Enterococcus avium]MDT2513988.1 hypothetical protein [Enterococcus avium]NVN61015.1 hypothetical protein [Enterococcus avium]NVN74932.1 hypothetical protein [Enterococcus avium]